MSKKKNVVLSASRLKTLEDCSYLYYAKYFLRLPDTTNDGARRGSVVHKVFEVLLNPRHKKHYDAIIKKGTAKGLPVMDRFLKLQCHREGLTNEFDNKGVNNMDLIHEMIMVGLRHDFFCQNAKLEDPEIEFNYDNEDPPYSIRGFIDKIAERKIRSKRVLDIWDYKSSASQFEGEDLDANVQAMMYSLYAKRVRSMDAVVRFVFLRFPEDPVQELEFSDDVLEGFEMYLAHITEFLENFNEKKGRSNMASKQPYPARGEGFRGPLMCGYAKYPGHTSKKTGKEYWHCPYKFPFEYYALLDKDGEVLKTAFKKSELTAEKGQKIMKKEYGGCPSFN